MIFELIFSLKALYFLLSLLLAYVIYFYARIAVDKAQGRRPPGPWGLPFIGALLSMETEFHKALTRLGDIYGPVYSVDVTGVVPSVVISDGEMCRELFKHPALNGRTKDASMEVWIQETSGLFMLDDNKRWRLSRKNAVKALSLFSTPKNSKLSASVVKSTDAFKVTLEEREGQTLDLRDDVFGVFTLFT